MTRFEDFTYDDATAEIARRKIDRLGDAYATNHGMAELHDFWQGGKLWVGPRGSPEAWEARVRAAVEAQFVPGSAILEALANFTRGLFGKQANIQAVPVGPVAEGSAEEKALDKEAEELVEALSVWWDRVELWAKMREVGSRSRWAGWGALRLRIPAGRLKERKTVDGVVPELPSFATLAEALEAIELEAPEPDHCIVIQHPDTQQRAALFHFARKTDGKDENHVELWYQEGEATALRILRQNGEPEGPYSYPWGGRLPVAEMDGEVMLTEPVRRAECALAFAATNVVRVGETAGFRERYTTNAEPAGLWLPTPPMGQAGKEPIDDGKGGKLYFHPLPRSLGAGVTTDLVGIPIEAGADGEKRATPGITIADPVDPEYATKVVEFGRGRVLQLCHQGHLALTARGEASGNAYEQARATFAGDLQLHVDPAERALTQALEAVVTMADSMTTNPAKVLERLRLIATLTPDAGPVSPEYSREARERVKEALLSRSTAMAQLGTDDTAAELDAIDQDPLSELAITERRAKAMAAFPDEVPLVVRAILVGYAEEEAKLYFGEADAARVRGDDQARDEIRAALERGRTEPKEVAA